MHQRAMFGLLASSLTAAMALPTAAQNPASTSAGGQIVRVTPPVALLPAATSIDVKNKSGAVGETVTLDAGLLSKPPDVNAKFLGRELKFFVDGKEACSGKIVGLNIASCSWKVPDLTQGMKPLEARFAGDSAWAASKASAQILVAKAIAKLSVDPTEIDVYKEVTPGDPLIFVVSLIRTTDKQGIDGRLVTFSANGQPAGKGTMVNGYAQLKYNVPRDIPGDIHVEVFFGGDEYYLPAGADHTFGVWHVRNGYLSILSAPDGSVGQRLTYRAQLTETPGVGGDLLVHAVVEGQNLEFIFDHWDGRQWSAGWNIQGVTDKSGIASVTDKPPDTYGNLRVRVDPNSNWVANEVSKTVTIARPSPAPPSATDISVPNRSGNIGQTVALSAHVKRASDGSPRSSLMVGFEIAGFSVGADRTNASGDATVNAKLTSEMGIGKHAVTAKTGGDPENKAGEGSGTITIGASQK